MARASGLEKTGNWRVTLPLVPAHNPVNLYSNLNLWSTGSISGANPNAAAAATQAAAAPAAAAAAPAATAGGQVSLQQQGTIIVQHQGYLQAGAPYPQPQ